MSDCPTCHCRFATPSALRRHQRDMHNKPRWETAKSAKRPQAPVCPACGNTAALSAGKYGIKASCCGLWSWGYKPLVDRDTHIAQMSAADARRVVEIVRAGSLLVVREVAHV